MRLADVTQPGIYWLWDGDGSPTVVEVQAWIDGRLSLFRLGAHAWDMLDEMPRCASMRVVGPLDPPAAPES